MQTELFPLKIVQDYPCDPKTAKLRRIVRADDGLTYAAKGKDNDYTPVNEWVCANIARTIGVPAPDFKILQDYDDSLLFGSKWETGLVEQKLFCSQVEDPAVYSSIHAFDILMLNIDRHRANFLIQEVEGFYKFRSYAVGCSKQQNGLLK